MSVPLSLSVHHGYWQGWLRNIIPDTGKSSSLLPLRIWPINRIWRILLNSQTLKLVTQIFKINQKVVFVEITWVWVSVFTSVCPQAGHITNWHSAYLSRGHLAESHRGPRLRHLNKTKGSRSRAEA